MADPEAGITATVTTAAGDTTTPDITDTAGDTDILVGDIIPGGCSRPRCRFRTTAATATVPVTTTATAIDALPCWRRQNAI